MNDPFPPELRTAAIVPRWSVVYTLNKDVVSSHSFFVAVYAFQIANLIRWKGNLSNLMVSALFHDLEENISGDLVSPVKKEILDYDKAAIFFRKKMMERMPTVVNTLDVIEASDDANDIDLIIKTADRLDALLFLVIEQRMGNRHVFSRCGDAQERLQEAWMNLPFSSDAHNIDKDGDMTLSRLWSDVVLPSIKAHEQYGGSGV